MYHKSIQPTYTAWIEKFLKSAVKDVNVCVMRGYTRALGVISPILQTHFVTTQIIYLCCFLIKINLTFYF